MDVIESIFALGDMEPGIQLSNGLTVGGGIEEMDLSFTVRIGEGAGGLDGKIGVAEDGIVIAGQSLEETDIGVVEVGAQAKSVVAGEMAVLEPGGGVEFSRSVTPAQRGVVERDGLEGKLDGGGKRVPLRVELMGVGRGGQGDLEIVSTANCAGPRTMAIKGSQSARLEVETERRTADAADTVPEAWMRDVGVVRVN